MKAKFLILISALGFMYALTPSAFAGGGCTPTSLAFSVPPPPTATAGATVTSFSVQVQGAGSCVATTFVANINLGIYTNPACTVPAGALSGNSVAPAGGTGTATFNAVSYASTGAYYLSASSGGPPAVTPTTCTPITFSAATATHFVLSGAPGATSGSSYFLTVTAKDAGDATVTGYNGSVHFTSSDGSATLPYDYLFAPGDAGVKVFSSTVLNTVGSQTFTATEVSSNPSVTGTSGSITVGPGAAAHFVVTGAGSATAGASYSLTVKAIDAAGNTATGYAGTVHFHSSDGAATLPSDYLFVGGDAGVKVFSATLNTAGSKSIDVHDALAALIVGASSPITVSPGAATMFVLTGVVSMAAGSSYSLAVTAKDAVGNVATGYTGTVHITSSDGAATLPSDYLFVGGDAGVKVFSPTLNSTGPQTLTATDTLSPLITGTSGSITVTPGAAAYFVLTGAGTATAGSDYSLTVTAKDGAGNTVTGYAGTVHFTSSDGAATLPSDYLFVGGDAGVKVFSPKLNSTGPQTLTATDPLSPLITGTSGSITVNPGAATHFVLMGAGFATVGSSYLLTVTAKDAGGNTATGYTGTVHITSSDGAATLPSDYLFIGGDAGVKVFSPTLNSTGSQSLTATDTITPSITGTLSNFPVQAGAATHFMLSGAGVVPAGTSYSVTVTAKDAGGNTANGYTGTVHITSSDGAAALPSDYLFVNGEGGVKVFSLTLRTAGARSLTATDTIDPSITGTLTGIAVTVGTTTQLVFTTAPSSTGTTNTNLVQQPVVRAQDAYGNTDSNYGAVLTIGAYTDNLCTVPGNGTLSSSGSFTAGVANFSGIRYTRMGDFYIGVSSGGLTPACSTKITLSGGVLSPFVNCKKLQTAGYTIDFTSERNQPAGACNANEIPLYSESHGVPTPVCVINDCGVEAKVCRSRSLGDLSTHYYCGSCPAGNCP